MRASGLNLDDRCMQLRDTGGHWTHKFHKPALYMLSIPVFTFIECVKRLDMRLLRRHGSGRLSTASTSARVL